MTACDSAGNSHLPGYAPQSADAAIKAVSLGISDSNRFDHSRTGTRFPDGTTRVLVWYRWDGADAGTRIDNRWYMEDALVLDQGEVIAKTSGTAAWILMMGGDSPLPAAGYKVELLENGTVVSTVPFRIGN